MRRTAVEEACAAVTEEQRRMIYETNALRIFKLQV